MFAAQRSFARIATQQHSSRAFSSKCRVAVLGAAGGIGQPLSLLTKLDPNVSEVALFDVVNTPGVAADLSHINTPAKLVSGAVGMDNIGDALTGTDVVIIPAGVPRKPGMTRDDLFNINAKIVMGLAEACGKHCPEAMFCIISNPVNSMVPLFAETLKKIGVYNKKKLFGVTTLDVTRANTFVSENQGFAVGDTKVNVIGGHAGTTILPLLSQVPKATFDQESLDKLTYRIQFGGDEVVQAKDGAGSATLSMAFAGAQFASRLISAMNGEKDVVECTFVENDLTDAPFFATPCTLGPDGVEKVHSFGTLSAYEQAVFDKMLPDLVAQCEKGSAFVKNA